MVGLQNPYHAVQFPVMAGPARGTDRYEVPLYAFITYSNEQNLSFLLNEQAKMEIRELLID